MKPAIGAGATIQDLMGSGAVREHKKECVIKKLVGHSRTKTGMQYSIRWYGYKPSEDTFERAEFVPQPLTDKYWQAVQKRRMGLGRPRRP